MFFNPGNGYIGIRTSSPTANLDVNGSVKFQGHAQAVGALTAASSATVQGALRVDGNTQVGSGGTPLSVISTGTFTMTLNEFSNIASTTSSVAHFVRIGNIVHVHGTAQIAASAASATGIDFVLPIASNLTGTSDCAGAGANEVDDAVRILANTGRDTCELDWSPVDTAAHFYSFFLSYVVQ